MGRILVNDPSCCTGAGKAGTDPGMYKCTKELVNGRRGSRMYLRYLSYCLRIPDWPGTRLTLGQIWIVDPSRICLRSIPSWIYLRSVPDFFSRDQPLEICVCEMCYFVMANEKRHKYKKHIQISLHRKLTFASKNNKI